MILIKLILDLSLFRNRNGLDKIIVDFEGGDFHQIIRHTGFVIKRIQGFLCNRFGHTSTSFFVTHDAGICCLGDVMLQ